MTAVTVCSDLEPKKKTVSLFPLFPHLFAIKWWDRMPWSSFFECWVLRQLFHSLLWPSTRGSLILLCFLRLGWCHLHVCCCSVTQLCPTLCNPCTAAWQASLSFTISWSLLKLISIKLVMPSNNFIPCHRPSLPAFNLSQHQGLFQWVSSSHQVAKVLALQLQHQSFQWIFRTDFL